MSTDSIASPEPPDQAGTTPEPDRLGRHVPGGGHVPDDGRGPGTVQGREVVPGELGLASSVIPSVACRVDRVLGPRHDPAVVLVPGRRGLAVLAGEPVEARQSLPFATLHAAWRALILIALGDLPPVDRPGEDQLHVRRHPHANRPRLLFLLFLIGLAKPMVRWIALGVILVGYWLAFALYPAAGPASIIRPSASRRLAASRHGFASHWNKNSNLAWAFDRWFLNLFPRKAVREKRRRLRHTQLHPDPRDDDPGPDRRRLAARAGEPRGKITRLVVAGVVCLILGLALDRLGICPIVKRIWTPSWVLFSGGILLRPGTLYALIDLTGYTGLDLSAPGHRPELDRRLLHRPSGRQLHRQLIPDSSGKGQVPQLGRGLRTPVSRRGRPGGLLADPVLDGPEENLSEGLGNDRGPA